MNTIDLTQDSDSDSQTLSKTLPANGKNLHPPRPAFGSSLTHRSPVSLKRKQESLEWPSVFNNSTHQPNLVGLGFKDTHDNSASHPSHFLQTDAQRHLQSFTSFNYQDHTASQNKRPLIAPPNGFQNQSSSQIIYEKPSDPPFTSHKHPRPSTPSPGPSQENVNVVIPSPSRQLKREIAAAKWTSVEPGPTGLSQEYYPTDALEKRALKGAYPTSRKANRAEVPFQIGPTAPFLTSRPEVNRQLQLSLQRKLSAIKGPPVTFAATDQRQLAQFENFEFINSNKLRRGVQPVLDEFVGGCSCATFCDPARCTCLETEESDSSQTIIPYERAKDDARLMVLTPEFLKRNVMISECGSRCDCGRSCWNRVVQSGRRIRLEIFPTGDRGFGLRSPDRIRAGQFIDCYLGEVITKEVADVREDLCMAKHGHSYLFGLDWFDVAEEDMFVVDGQKFGAPTRFMNHSCNPNCRMFPVTRNRADQRLYDLAFFSLKEIPPNTELTFDYNPGSETVDHVDPHAVPCLCGESNCRGQLWPNQRKGTR